MKKKKNNNSHLIIQQFLLEANVHGVERSSSAWSLVFVRVHVKVQLGFYLLALFFPSFFAGWMGEVGPSLRKVGSLPRPAAALGYLSAKTKRRGR